jgi:cell division septum initiation protein DivIVA
MELYVLLDDRDKAAHPTILCDLTSLLMHLISKGQKGMGAKADQKAKNIASHLASTMERIKHVQGLTHARGSELDGVLGQAIDECQEQYVADRTDGADPTITTTQGTGKTPKERDAKGGKRDDRRKDRSQSPTVVRAAHTSDDDIKGIRQRIQELGQQIENLTSGVASTRQAAPQPQKAQPAGQQQRAQPAGQPVQAASPSGYPDESGYAYRSNPIYRAPRLSPEELPHYLVPITYKFTGCWTCGHPDHRGSECDVAFTSSEGAEAGVMNLDRMAAQCIGTRTSRADVMTEFNRRMEFVRKLKRFKGFDEDAAASAAQRYHKYAGQAVARLRHAMAEKKMA